MARGLPEERWVLSHRAPHSVRGFANIQRRTTLRSRQRRRLTRYASQAPLVDEVTPARSAILETMVFLQQKNVKTEINLEVTQSRHDDPRRRALMRQGFLFLLIALVFGLAIATLPHPSRWLAAHLTAFLTGLILVVMALAWNEFRLTDRQLTLAYVTGLVAAYGGLVGNVFGAIANLPGPASNPGVAPPVPQAIVFYAILAIIVPSLFVSFGLVLYGMRGAATGK